MKSIKRELFKGRNSYSKLLTISFLDSYRNDLWYFHNIPCLDFLYIPLIYLSIFSDFYSHT